MTSRLKWATLSLILAAHLNGAPREIPGPILSLPCLCRADGTSNLGRVNPGDMFLVDYVPFEQIKRDDLVVYWDAMNHRYISHYAQFQSNGSWVVKGFNNSKLDRVPVSRLNYVGLVVKITPIP